ncbi:MAG: hypothetical protein HQK67_11930, partial [Desulfamplus sp.]|nr:hypothetical protein [Desulfamplus sp.]
MFELIYTSYPRGLQSGTSGFTSVAYTEGIPKNYIHLCESLSGYLFLYPAGHPMYDLNPEIYSHYRFRDRKKDFSILSRVAVSDKDYTGRENKIAHHIVVDTDEQMQCSGGPAWAMMHGNLFIKKWDRDPCLLDSERVVLPLMQTEEFRAPLWQNSFGDAGGAGILAQSALTYPEIPSFVLFDPFEQRSICLPLIMETLNLIPPEKRWDITFSTYFISKPMDSDCLWRCCPTQPGGLKTGGLLQTGELQTGELQTSALQIGGLQPGGLKTDALDYIRKYPDSIVIDLNQKKIYGKAPENKDKNELVICARQGTPPPWAINKASKAISPDTSLLSSSSSLSSSLSSLDDSSLPPSSFENSSLSQAEIASLLEKEPEKRSFQKQNSNMPDTHKRSFRMALLILLIFSFATLLLTALFSSYIPWISENITKENAHIIKENPDIKKENVDKIKKDHDITKQNADIAKDNEDILITKTDIINEHQSEIRTFPDNVSANKMGYADNNKKIVLSFYDDIQQIVNDIDDLKKTKCRIVKIDGTEIDVNIEKPVANDTPNWTLMPDGSKQPAGYISMENVSLYDKDLYSAIYLDVPSKEDANLIWVSPVQILPSMISEGQDPNTLEITFAPEMSDLLNRFLSLISTEDLTAVVELKQSDDNLAKSDDELTKSNTELTNIGDNLTKTDNNLKNPDENITQSKQDVQHKQDTKNKQDPQNKNDIQNKTVLHPVCSLKRDIKNNNIRFIQLKFDNDEFQAIMKSRDSYVLQKEIASQDKIEPEEKYSFEKNNP